MSSDSEKPIAAPTFGTTRRRALTVSPDALCHIEPLRPGTPLPVVVRPAVPGIDLPSWLQGNRNVLAERLSTHGGVLFRGFEITSSDAFQSCIAAMSGVSESIENSPSVITRIPFSLSRARMRLRCRRTDCRFR